MSSTPSSKSRDLEVYETPDPPVLTSNYDDDRKSQAVETMESNVQTSFSKFQGKPLFSNWTRGALQHGFRTEPTDIEIDPLPRQPETLLQRYQRLKHEVADLVADVVELKESNKSLSDVSPADVASDLQELERHLQQLELDRTLGISTLTGAAHAHHTLVLKELEAQLAAAKSTPTPTEGQAALGPVYELFVGLESAKFGHLSKLSEVEERLTVLETLVGKPDQKGSVLAGELDAEHTNLIGSVMGLQTRLAVLDASHIASIAGQLQLLLKNLKDFQAKAKDIEPDPEQKAKVSEALEAVSHIAPLANLIPDLVDRLKALRELHEHATTLASTMASISKNQESVQQEVESLRALLVQVQNSMGENLETLKTNFSNLESRLTKLQK